MIIIPKALKFLRPHYKDLKAFFETTSGEFRKEFADLLSVMAVTLNRTDEPESLNYVL